MKLETVLVFKLEDIRKIGFKFHLRIKGTTIHISSNLLILVYSYIFNGMTWKVDLPQSSSIGEYPCEIDRSIFYE
jgi:hypothetical protein